ncbi:hypothetical protein QFZ32_004609 [Streptomyces canus]|nr:hypothetical protein [Streptomyces canus]
MTLAFSPQVIALPVTDDDGLGLGMVNAASVH